MQPTFQQIADLLSQAEAALGSGRAGEAAGLAERVLGLAPGHADGLHVMGLARAGEGRVQDAVDLLSQAVAKNGRVAAYHLDLGQVLGAAGQVKDAKSAFKRGLKKNKDSWELMAALAQAHLMLDEPQDALALLVKAAKLNPSAREVHSMLGVAQQQTGRMTAAVDSYRRAIGLGSNDANDHANLAGVLQGEQDIAGAIEAYRKAVELDPKLQRAQASLGNLLMRSTDYLGAIAPLQMALKLKNNDVQAARNLAYSLAAVGQHAPAIQLSRQLVEALPTSVDMLNQLAFAYLCAKQPENALEACGRALAILPNCTHTLAFQSAALNELNRRKEAGFLLDFDRLIEAKPLALPEGYADIAAFNEALVAEIYDHPSLKYSDMNRSLSQGQGTQELFTGDEPSATKAFKARIHEAVAAYHAAHPADADHPFLMDKPDSYRITCWASVMDNQGFHSVHFHPSGWLSGVYYPLLPDEVTRGQTNRQDGWIEFGRAFSLIGSEDTPPVHLIRPEEGLVVLFPSYFGHQTIPFESDQKRISVAFDVEPVNA